MLKKIKEKAKKILVTLLSATTAGSGFAAAAIQTASADGEWTLSEGTHIRVPWKWRHNGNDGAIWESDVGHFTLTNKTTGEVIETFCIQNGNGTKEGGAYNNTADMSYWNSLSDPTKNIISMAGKWYYQYHQGDMAAYAATQWTVWNATNTSTRNNGKGGYVDWDWMDAHVSDTSLYNQTVTYYNEIINYMNNYGTQPNFNQTNLTLNPGQSVTLTDTNGVFHLQEWSINVAGLPSGVSMTKNGDNLIVSVAPNFKGVFDGDVKASIRFLDMANAHGNQFRVFTSNEINDKGKPLQEQVYPVGIVDPEGPTIHLRVTSGKITVEKYDDTTFEALSGTQFQVFNEQGTLITTLTTDYQGKATTDWLPFGNYTVKESKASKGYNNDNANGKAVNLNAENVTVEFYDKIIQGTSRLVKTDAETGQKLSDVEFAIYKTKGISDTPYASEVFVQKVTTNADGVALSGLLDYGEYYMVETQAKYGFFNDKTKYNFSIKEEGVTVPINATNRQTTSTVTITKLDNNSDGYGVDAQGNKLKLAGAKFQLYEHVISRDAMNNIISETDAPIGNPVTTNENGVAVFSEKLAFSNTLQANGSYYYVKEVEAPFGYKLNNSTVRVEYNYPGQFVENVDLPVTFENEIIKGKIKVIKVDKENNVIKLAGAEYDIINANGTIVDHVVTNAKGEALTKDLRPGKYTVRETKAPTNYQKDAKDVEVTLTAVNEDGKVIVKTQEVIIGNTHNKGKIKLIKVDGLTVDYKEKCTDENDPTTCEIVTVTTDDTVYLPNVDFAIYDKNDLSNPIATITTDKDGKAEYVLNTGEYYYQELTAPEGYNVNPKLVSFKFENHGEEREDIVSNMTMYGQLSVYKVGEKLSGIKVDEEGVTQLVWEESFMPGAKFELYADEDIIHPITGKVIYKKDSVVREIITDADGEALVENLPLGKYYIKEIISPAEHSVYDVVKDTKYIELTEEDANFEGVVESQVTFKNERVMVDPSIYKQGASLVDVNDEEKGYNYAPLAGAKFGIYNTEEIKNAYTQWTQADVDKINDFYVGKIELTEDEMKKYDVNKDNKVDTTDSSTILAEIKKTAELTTVTIPADTLLATMITTEDGFADVTVKLPFGKYYIKEIEAPEGYHLNEEKYDFELVWDQKMQDKTVLDIVVTDEENPITNYKIEMPKTGISLVSLYTMAGVTALAVAGLAVMIKKRKITE